LGKRAQIDIEEEHWSDLKITNGNCVYVVEFKAGAPLEAKQNPDEPRFGKLKRSPIRGSSKKGIVCGERLWNVCAKVSSGQE